MTSRFSRMSSNEEVEGGDAKPSQIGQVVVHMVSGSNLAAADKGGTSDPYAKVRVGAKDVSPPYLPYVSPTSPQYLPCISPTPPL